MKFNQMFKKFLAVAAATSMVIAGTFTVNAPANDVECEPCSLANYAEGTYWSDWQIKGMGLDKFQNAFENKANLPEIVVGVLDTGISNTDSGFAGRILENKAISVTDANSVFQSAGHGTNTIRGLIDATPNNVKILPIRISDSNNTIYSSAIPKGINAAVNANVDVIMITAGGGGGIDSATDTALRAAEAKGIIVCTAAGNESSDTKYDNPSGSPYVISVAAAADDMSLTKPSNYNATISSFSHNLGTSYATPNVVAVAAMLKTMDRSINRAKMVDIISTMAIDLGEPGKDSVYGNGLLYMGDFIQNNNTQCLHTYTKQELKHATCNASGQIRFTCSKCNTSFIREEQPRHQYNVEHVFGGCTRDSYFKIECTLCGNVKDYELQSSATGHNFQTYTTTSGKGKKQVTTTVVKCSKCGIQQCTSHSYTKTTVTEADCTHSGLAKYTCNNCGDTYSEAIPKLDHTYTSKVVTEPTKTTTGIIEYTCTGCGDTYYESTAYQFACTEHSYTKTVVKAATCTTAGLERYTCSKCGDSYDKTIASTGHTAGKGKNKKTCTKCGANLK